MKTVDLLDLSEDARALVGECEVTGRRTVFTRNGKPVAILVSYDELMALRETIAIGNDPALRARIEAAEGEIQRNALLLVEDLLEHVE